MNTNVCLRMAGGGADGIWKWLLKGVTHDVMAKLMGAGFLW